MKILLVCERSAGHIFPALTVGEKIGKKSNIYFFATSDFLKKYIERQGFNCFGKSLTFRNLIIEGIWRLFEAIYLILRLRPKKVIGFGGRDSFFLVLFSSLLRIKTIIYEPNVKMGKANKFLAPFVDKVLRGFPGKESSDNKTIGIPLRKNIKKIDKDQARKILGFNDEPVIFCFGGSQGSSFLNHIFLKFIQNFKNNCQVIHLTGKDEYSKILSQYAAMDNKSFVKDFYYQVEILYSAADMVVSRAGAITLGEISFYELPAILLPHPKAGNHQVENAFYFEKKEAAKVYLQNEFSFEDFSYYCNKFIKDEALRQTIQGNLRKIKLGVSYEDFGNNSSVSF